MKTKTYSQRLKEIAGALQLGKGDMAEKLGLSKESRGLFKKHWDGSFDNDQEVLSKYVPRLDAIEKAELNDEGDVDELKKLRLHIQLLQSQMKKVYKKLGIETDYEELKW